MCLLTDLRAAEESEVNLPNTPTPHPPVSLFCQIKFLYYVMTLKIDKGFMMSLYDVFANLMAGKLVTCWTLAYLLQWNMVSICMYVMQL